VDRYAGYLVVQALSTGAEAWKGTCADILEEILHPDGIFERSDGDVRAKEGLEKAAGPLRGERPPELVEIEENRLRFLVDLAAGHKTGMYLDQRDNRRLVAGLCGGKSVLNAFGYTGGFGVYAGAAGAAAVCHLDSSADSLSLARRNVALNHADDGCAHEYLEGNAFSLLRGFRAAGRTFDVIILDPPKFAENTGQLARALNGYKDINLVALQILRPGGVLVTFSCSGLVSPAVFQQVVWEAALDAGKNARVVGRLTQAPDHPVLLHFPEGEYLKGLVVRA
jgi:23S rRNA (cytosine1962-C5)-methyltransferase